MPGNPVSRRRKIGDYAVGKNATRSVTKAAGVRTAVFTKKSGDVITKTATKTAEAKNTRLGAYARANKVVDPTTGATTYTKKGGGTVTVAVSASAGAKKRRGRRGDGSTPTPPPPPPPGSGD